MDLFVLSSHSEGMPNALLEGFASGIPAIATDVGGVRDIIDSDQSGIIVPVNDIEKMVAAMHQFDRNLGMLKSAGIAARQRVESHFSLTVMVKKLENLYLGGH